MYKPSPQKSHSYGFPLISPDLIDGFFPQIDICFRIPPLSVNPEIKQKYAVRKLTKYMHALRRKTKICSNLLRNIRI